MIAEPVESPAETSPPDEWDLFEASPEECRPVDRSTLEAYATCPQQARLVEAGVGLPSVQLEAGSHVHDAYAEAVKFFVDGPAELGDMVSPADVEATAKSFLLNARPDIAAEVQTAGLDRLKRWVSFLFFGEGRRRHGSVMRFDGGEGSKSGQLAVDFEDHGVRVTSEVDLLLATASEEVVEVIDYKTGHKHYDAEAIRSSFQFRLHAFLIWERYGEFDADSQTGDRDSEADTVRYRVFHSRTGQLSPKYEFRRLRDYEAIRAQVIEAVASWRRWHTGIREDAPAWPLVGKCDKCPVAHHCTAAREAGEGATAEEVVDRMAAMTAALDRMKKRAGAFVDEHGAITTAAGNCYGFRESKSNRKPPKRLTAVAANEEGEGDD